MAAARESRSARPRHAARAGAARHQGDHRAGFGCGQRGAARRAGAAARRRPARRDPARRRRAVASRRHARGARRAGGVRRVLPPGTAADRQRAAARCFRKRCRACSHGIFRRRAAESLRNARRSRPRASEEDAALRAASSRRCRSEAPGLGRGERRRRERPGDARASGSILSSRQVNFTMDEPVQEVPVKRSRLALLTLIAVIIAAGLAALFWLDARQRIGGTQEEFARRLRDIEGDVREARSTARQSQELLREAQVKIGQLESRLAESQSQQLALEALYQELSRNRDEWQLAEIEQVLAIASQQLQLAGNVRAALLALQLAEARLARADRPQFAPVRRALARDIERLRVLPAIDLPAMSMRLDSLVAAVDALPLAFDERAERVPVKEAPPGGERGVVARLGAEVWNELRQLVVVRRVDAPEPPLLPPSQAYFLRENLRLRLLNARLSLLARDEAGYREDLRAAQTWIRRYFDTHSKQTADTLAQLKALSSPSLSFEMPSISESLEAVRGFKSRRERAPG